jgi:hypothetical protein
MILCFQSFTFQTYFLVATLDYLISSNSVEFMLIGGAHLSVVVSDETGPSTASPEPSDADTP